MKCLIIVVIFSFFLINCNAQKNPERIGRTSVSIFNNSNSMLTILLGDPSVKMDTFKLKENQVWSSPTYKNDPKINIQTQNHTVAYQLRLGKSYMIFWNKPKKYWDIMEIKNRE